MLVFLLWFALNTIYPTSSTYFPSNKHKKTLTSITATELGQYLKDGHVEVFDKLPSKNRLASAWAQVAFESGQGSQMYNYNFGCIERSDNSPYFVLAGHKFRNNNTPLDGSIAYWRYLKQRCHSVFGYFDAGDITGAAQQLERCGYYRVGEEVYERNMKILYWKALTVIVKELN